MSDDRRKTERSHAKVAGICAAVVVAMVGAAYASVPLYDLFCRVTGYGGTTQRAETYSDEVLDETIVVRFDANVAGGLPWEFAPEERRVELRIGETGQMVYLSHNTSDAMTAGTSTYNVSPPSAGLYFNKIQCFCFTEQPLEAGETVEMPVVFFIDPRIVEDKNARDVGEITLSYTFYPKDGDGAESEPLAAAPQDDTDRKQL